jgi:GT2 family glycosyltransferase
VTASADVCAVVLAGPRAEPLPASLTALAHQRQPPSETVVVHVGEPATTGHTAHRSLHVALEAGTAGACSDGVRAACGTGAEWIWLLDGLTVPGPDALEALLEGAARGSGRRACVLAAGRIVTADGSTHPDALPWPVLLDKEAALGAAAERLVAVRAARHGSLLVRRSAIATEGLPRSSYRAGGDDLEWTSRLLRAGPGFLVPGSVAVRRRGEADRPGGGAPRAWRGRRNALDLLVRGPFSMQERLWFGYGLARAPGSGPRPSRSPRATT